jgi:hypothetical protein
MVVLAVLAVLAAAYCWRIAWAHGTQGPAMPGMCAVMVAVRSRGITNTPATAVGKFHMKGYRCYRRVA